MAEEIKVPHPIDTHVGMRVRLKRTMLGLSQEKLGGSLGVTFQQVQKYEKGSNRISASRLQSLSEILEVPVSFFFEDVPGTQKPTVGQFAEGEASNYFVDFLSSSEGIQLIKAFTNIKDTNIRKKVIDLTRAIANEEE